MIITEKPKNCMDCPLRISMLRSDEEYAYGCKVTWIIVDDYDELPDFCPFYEEENEDDKC